MKWIFGANDTFKICNSTKPADTGFDLSSWLREDEQMRLGVFRGARERLEAPAGELPLRHLLGINETSSTPGTRVCINILYNYIVMRSYIVFLTILYNILYHILYYYTILYCIILCYITLDYILLYIILLSLLYHII